MALADITVVKKRVDEILGANPTAYSASPSGTVGAFQYSEEINQVVLESDEFIATRAYFNSINRDLAKDFLTFSGALAPGDSMPFHYGQISKIELAKNVKVFAPGDVDISNERITITAHGFTTGDEVSLFSSGTLPTGITANATYYVIVVNANTISLSTSYALALVTLGIVNLTGTGSGSHNIVAWQTGIEAQSPDDVLSAIAVGESYVQSGAFDNLFARDSGNIYTTATFFRGEYPAYTRTAALQVKQAEETLVVANAVKILVKNASPAPFKEWTDIANEGIERLIKDGYYQAPEMGN